MSAQIDYTPLGGGLDLRSSALTIKSGRLLDCLNFEEAFGVQGYRRVFGYERYDGHLEPHTASYITVPFKAGTVVFTVGEILNGPSATGQLIAYTLQSGTFGAGTAAGFIVLTNVTGTWANNDYIKQGSNARATAADPALNPDLTDTDNFNYLRLARNALRTYIQKVPGEGPVSGVVLYKNVVYAFRNVVGSTSATMWASSATGWTAIKTGFQPGGNYRFQIANFTGDAKNLKLFGVNGRDSLFSYDGTTVTFAAPIFGSEATSTTSNTVTTGSHSFTYPQSTRSYAVGDLLTARDSTNPANSMTGPVTAVTTTSVTINATSVTGSGTVATWNISASDYRDKPYDIAEFKDHMFLAYTRGQLQTSNIGDPMTYTTTATLFGLGDEITGIVAVKGGTLAAFCINRIFVLTGTSQTDWALDQYSDGTGAIFGTPKENGGNVLFLDSRGVTALQSTQAYGSFEPALFSEDVAKLLAPQIPNIVGARVTRGSYQYRLYTNTGLVLTFGLLTSNPTVRPKDVSPTQQQYAHVPTCFAEGKYFLDDAMFFGTADGYVMRESVGTSFDGATIQALIRLPFNQYKSPSNNKRFLKLLLELESSNPLNISFLQLFDYDDGTFDQSLLQKATATQSGGQFDVAVWNQFVFSLPMVSRAEVNVDGLARNMAVLLFLDSDVVDPFELQGLMTHYTVRGLRR